MTKQLSMTPSAIRARNARQSKAARKAINGGINPATKLPHTPAFVAAR